MSKKIRNAGQCIFLYKLKNTSTIIPTFSFTDSNRTNILKVEVKKDNIYITLTSENILLAIPSNNINDISAQLWFSLDAKNMRLYAGIGEPRLETSIFLYSFPQTQDRNYKKLLESLIHLEYDEDTIDFIKLIKDPVTRNIPLLIKDTEELTMDDIAKGKYMPIANLSTVSQKMYRCISGKKFVLNTADFPDFVDAIEYSIRTPGLWCNTMLQKKSREFDKDKPNILETYLRITLGENNGESPGVPYVMEIWPVGHYSPVHSHAGSEAVIRVLNGTIHVKLYPYLSHNISNNIKPFSTVDLKENDFTWISPTLNQTHQLVNKSKIETCITIQCYMYDDKDRSHYDYFDYIDGHGHIQPYEPDSDMDFINFKELMRQEWSSAKAAAFTESLKKVR
uniref:Cysteine dioxygenase n=1 Tax=viral metagenome TaxID=1070528 RepID=A0A6C0HZ28_9ZZZZ